METTLKQCINRCVELIQSNDTTMQEIGLEIMLNTLKLKPKQIIYLLFVRGLIFKKTEAYKTGFVGEVIYNNKDLKIPDSVEDYHYTAVITGEVNFLNSFIRIFLLQDSISGKLYYKVFYTEYKEFHRDMTFSSPCHTYHNLYDSILFKHMLKLINNYITPVGNKLKKHG
tara:strand:- start:130 stop:639 length:510 start_codon:yes stop_codon:yes gene_type:complete